jgi:hypothetical protein
MHVHADTVRLHRSTQYAYSTAQHTKPYKVVMPDVVGDLASHMFMLTFSHLFEKPPECSATTDLSEIHLSPLAFSIRQRTQIHPVNLQKSGRQSWLKVEKGDNLPTERTYLVLLACCCSSCLLAVWTCHHLSCESQS